MTASFRARIVPPRWSEFGTPPCRRRYGTSSIASSKKPTPTFYSTSTASSSDQGPALRVYRYVVDVHGQLFLHDTVPKNMTSCFKDASFLDFFFTRLRPNPSSPTSHNSLHISKAHIHDDSSHPSDWPTDASASGPSHTHTKEHFYKLAASQGYHWISPCGPELNFIKTQDTPLVFRDLNDQGALTYAGTLTLPFRPAECVVDPKTGYVYHPSPLLTSSRRRQTSSASSDPSLKYGRYSLLSSNLVLQRLAEGLDIDPDRFQHGDAGSFAWQGTRYKLGLLPPPTNQP